MILCCEIRIRVSAPDIGTFGRGVVRESKIAKFRVDGGNARQFLSLLYDDFEGHFSTTLHKKILDPTHTDSGEYFLVGAYRLATRRYQTAPSNDVNHCNKLTPNASFFPRGKLQNY